jgi:hypothetical protein
LEFKWVQYICSYKYFDIDNSNEDPNISGDPYKKLFVARLVSNIVLCILVWMRFSALNIYIPCLDCKASLLNNWRSITGPLYAIFIFLMFYHPFVRYEMQVVQSIGRSLHTSSGVESQAAKRQKLEGGYLHKVQ